MSYTTMESLKTDLKLARQANRTLEEKLDMNTQSSAKRWVEVNAELQKQLDRNDELEKKVEELEKQRLELFAGSIKNATLGNIEEAFWIMCKHIANNKPELQDWACEECVPYSDGIINGYRCAYHLAKEWLYHRNKNED